ncbi:MAG: DUF2029 domain-containing protein [Anaerolineae bacterium]|nr:DUF2029 domain-containing protein [Anaerolineae bacterium]
MSRRLLEIGIAALWIAFVGLAWFMSQNGKFGATDFEVYYRAARLLIDGKPLYNGTVDMVYLYPPLLAQLLIPLAQLSVETAWTVWLGFNALLLVGITAALSRNLRQRYWLWLITPIFLPALEALYIGQVTIILYTLFAGGWRAVKRDQHALAGALLALATWVKVYPVIVLAYFVWKRDWRVVGGAVVAGIALLALQFAISGAAPLTDMFDVLFALTNSEQAHLIVANASVHGFTAQLFQSYPNVTALLVSPTLYAISRIALTVGVIGGLLYATARSVDFDLQYGLAVITALLLSPTLFPTSMPPVLLTYFLLLRSRPTKRMIWFCTLACVTLSLYWLYVLGYSNDWRVSGLLLSFGFYTVVATWGVNFVLLRRRQTVAQREVILAGEMGS